MSILVSHMSALGYWRLHRVRQHGSLVGGARWAVPLDPPRASEVRRLGILGLDGPLDVTVGDKCARRKLRGLRTHVYSKSLPGGSAVDYGKGIYIASPELCFVQLARDLPLAKLVELGLELCGTYSLPHDAEAGPGNTRQATYAYAPLTNATRLAAFVARMAGADGQVRAATAMRWIIDGSASPMESVLSIMLTFPNRLGGYNLPKPQLNARIALKGLASRGKGSAAYCVCDMLWADARVAVAYDSDLYHTGPDRITEDSARRNALALMGIKAVSVTNRQLRSMLEFEKAATLIARSIGRRLRHGMNPRFLAAQRELRRLLL